MTSADHEKIDVKVIKEDAQWLSKNVKINILAALRITIIEFQSRSSRHLTGPLSSQDATNLQEAAGLGNGQGAAAFLTDLGAAGAADAEQIWDKFDNVEAKKHRLIDTYFSERRHFMMVANYALSIKLYDQLPIFTRGDSKLAQLYRLKPSSQAKDETETLLPAYLEVLSNSMGSLEAGIGSLTDDSLLLVEDVEMDWITTLLTEAVHVCSIILHLADSHHEDYAPSACVSQWFALMEAYPFFDNIPLVSIDWIYPKGYATADESQDQRRNCRAHIAPENISCCCLYRLAQADTVHCLPRR